jgi:hypothetical protein
VEDAQTGAKARRCLTINPKIAIAAREKTLPLFPTNLPGRRIVPGVS